jgi:hypothetical protein
MKGVIFNLLEDAVSRQFGADAWEDLICAASVGGAYTSLGSYPDEEIFALVSAASVLLRIEPGDVLQWFGAEAIPLLYGRYPELFAGHVSARHFVLSVNDIIHPEVRKLYSGAGCPHFHFDQREDGALLLGYRSPRRLCRLAHGFVLGASAHFGETAQVEHLLCMNEGAPMCRLAVLWDA